MQNLIATSIIGLTWILSVVFSGLPFILSMSESLALRIAALAVAPLIFAFVFPVMMGLISLPFQKGIVAGRFPREPFHKVYFCRRIFGLCWSQVFYFKPLYSVILTIPYYKALVLRLFGYRGDLGFTVYPDTWIRDLPLLKFGEGAYIANRATLGSNLVMSDGSIMVEGITIERKATVGHLCIIGTGCRVREGAEIGMRTSLGIRVDIHKSANIKPHCAINHGAVVGEGSSVGTMSLIGMKVAISPGIKVPAGANVPNGTVLQQQSDCDRFFSMETADLEKHRALMISTLGAPVLL